MGIRLAVLIVVPLLDAAVSAQQKFELWPGRTTFTSRGTIGTGVGETLQGVHATHHRGLGDNGAACVIPTLGAMLQDQNAATQETYHWVVRRGDDTSGPGVGTANLITRVGPLSTPKDAATVIAWQLNTTLTRPVELPDCESHFSFGIELSRAGNWTRDGLSTHTSFGSTAYPHQGTHARAEDHAWEIVGAAALAIHLRNLRTWRYALLVDNGVLQFGNGGDMYGMGGMFPAAGKPVTARASYPEGMATGASFLFLATERIAGVMQFPNTSRLFLGGAFFFVSRETISSAGVAEHTISQLLPAACAGSPRHHIQAVAMKGNLYVVTNAHSINP